MTLNNDSMMRRILKKQHGSAMSYHFLLLVFILINTISAESSSDDETPSVFEWLSGVPGFEFNPKLKMMGNEVHVNAEIDESEVLMVIPAEVILYKEESEEDDYLCTMFHTLWKEIALGEESNYAPYMDHIQKMHANDAKFPAMWSNIGKRLYETIGIKSFRLNEHLVWRMLPQHVTKWIRDYEGCFEALDDSSIEDETEEVVDDDSDIESELMLGTLTEAVISRYRVLSLVAKHQVDQDSFVPLYDQIEHHHIKENVKHQYQDDDSIAIVATRPISIGETLYRQTQACLHDCDEPHRHTVLDVLRTFGEVQSYPHYWHFSFGVSFIFNGSREMAVAGGADAAGPTLQWINPPEDEWQLTLMSQEYNRQLDLYSDEVLPSEEWIPEKEWKAMSALSESLIEALDFAVIDATDLMIIREDKRGDDVLEKDVGSSEEACPNSAGSDEGDTTLDSEVDESSSREKSAHSYARDPWAIEGCRSDECDIFQLNTARGCKKHNYNTIHNETAWVQMRAAYVATVGPRRSTIKSVHGTGMKVPYKVGHSPGRGRGIYATEKISKGTIVWKAEYTAAFSTGIQYRRFLASLDDVMACDMINWCYTSKDENGLKSIECDLDEASLFNSFDERVEYTIGCHDSLVEDPEDCETYAFALRDIKKGEELVTDYQEFSEAEWPHFGL